MVVTVFICGGLRMYLSLVLLVYFALDFQWNQEQLDCGNATCKATLQSFASSLPSEIRCRQKEWAKGSPPVFFLMQQVLPSGPAMSGFKTPTAIVVSFFAFLSGENWAGP